MLNWKNYLLFIFILILPIKVWSQYYVEVEEKALPKDLTSQVSLYLTSPNKAALVFDSSLPLEFKSSKEILSPVIRFSNYQVLIVTDGASAISILYDGNPTVLNFGQLMGVTKPSLKANEIKFFAVTLQAELEVRDITESEFRRGNKTLPVGPNISDALITLRVFPGDINLKIEEENKNTTKITRNDSEYLVFLSTTDVNQKKTLKITLENGEYKFIPIYELKAKDTRFFRISKPILANMANIDIVEDNQTKNPEILNKIIGNWSGTLGDQNSHLKIFEPNNLNNTIKAELYSNGFYLSYTGNYSISTNNRISISFTKSMNTLYDKINSNLDIEFSNDILSGLFLDDIQNTLDLAMLKSSNIPPNQNEQLENHLSEISTSLVSNWIIEDIFFTEITIERIDYTNTIFGFIKSSNGNCSFNTKVTGVPGNLSFSLKTSKFCRSLDYDLIANIGRTTTISIIDNKKGSFKNVGFFKRSSVKSNETKSETIIPITASKDDIYQVNKERIYFYSEPDISTIRNAYIIKGQIPEILSQTENFYFARYSNLGRITTGYLKKSDLTKINLKQLFSNSIWTGKFGENQIQVVITIIKKNNTNEFEIQGYNVLRQNRRPLRGKISSFYSNGINVVLNEPGTDTWDGVFNINFNFDGQASGNWKANNNRLSRTFTLKKQ